MARRRHRTEIEVTATATVCISDVLEEVSTDQLMDELKGRNDYAGGGFQPPIDAVFLEDLARALELGRHMDAPERRLAALKLREMIDPDQQRSARIAADYAKWQAEHSATPTA